MRIEAIPLTEIEFDHLAGLARVDSASGHGRVKNKTNPRLTANFWWLWLSGTALPLAAAILLIMAGASDSLTITAVIIGASCTAANLFFVIATAGYSSGDLAAIGRAFAIVTGWAGVILLVGAVVVVVLVVVVALLIAAAILAGLAGASNQ